MQPYIYSNKLNKRISALFVFRKNILKVMNNELMHVCHNTENCRLHHGKEENILQEIIHLEIIIVYEIVDFPSFIYI